MAAGVESFEVFEARATQFGISQAVVQQMKDAGLATIGSFAWCCGFQPGGADESPFVEAMTKLLGAAPDMGLMSKLRRLFYECHTTCLMDMRARLERTDEDTPRKLQLPERVARLDQLRNRYPGLTIEGELEFSYALLDRVIDQYEKNEVRYINLSDCTRRSQELDGEKVDHRLKVDIRKADGSLKITEEHVTIHAPLATDLEIRNALVRRALAYDAGNLITFTTMERWINKLFRILQEPPIEYHSRVNMAQIIRADKRLWAKLAEATRANIVPQPGQPKPLDQAVVRLMDDMEVTFLLLQMPAAQNKSNASSSNQAFVDHDEAQKSRDRGQPYQAHKKGKGKGKAGKSGKNSDKPKTSLHGSSFKLADGRPCCIFYNSPTGCNDKNTKVGKRCSRGFHLCGRILADKTVCSGDHPLHQCPK